MLPFALTLITKVHSDCFCRYIIDDYIDCKYIDAIDSGKHAADIDSE